MQAKVQVGLIRSIFSNLQTPDLLPPWRWTPDLTHLLFNSRQLSMSMDFRFRTFSTEKRNERENLSPQEI